MQLFSDGVMNREVAAQLREAGIQLPQPLEAEYKEACHEAEQAEPDRERLRERLQQQLK